MACHSVLRGVASYHLEDVKSSNHGPSFHLHNAGDSLSYIRSASSGRSSSQKTPNANYPSLPVSLEDFQSHEFFISLTRCRSFVACPKTLNAQELIYGEFGVDFLRGRWIQIHGFFISLTRRRSPIRRLIEDFNIL